MPQAADEHVVTTLTVGGQIQIAIQRVPLTATVVQLHPGDRTVTVSYRWGRGNKLYHERLFEEQLGFFVTNFDNASAQDAVPSAAPPASDTEDSAEPHPKRRRTNLRSNLLSAKAPPLDSARARRVAEAADRKAATARNVAAAQAEAEATLEQLGCSDEKELIAIAKALSLSTPAAPAAHISTHGVPAEGAPTANTHTHFSDSDDDDSDGSSGGGGGGHAANTHIRFPGSDDDDNDDSSGDGGGGHDDNGDDGMIHVGDEVSDDSGEPPATSPAGTYGMYVGLLAHPAMAIMVGPILPQNPAPLAGTAMIGTPPSPTPETTAAVPAPSSPPLGPGILASPAPAPDDGSDDEAAIHQPTPKRPRYATSDASDNGDVLAPNAPEPAPLLCGQLSNAGDFDFDVNFFLPLRTSWFIVGIYNSLDLLIPS